MWHLEWIWIPRNIIQLRKTGSNIRKLIPDRKNFSFRLKSPFGILYTAFED